MSKQTLSLLLAASICQTNAFVINKSNPSSFASTVVSPQQQSIRNLSPSLSLRTRLNVETPTETEAEVIKAAPTPPNPNEDRLGQKFGGYTAKQRLREEVESPFRKVRFLFFAGSSASALLALYFSATSTLKASLGGYSDAMPMDEALTNCAINLAGVVVCGYLAFRDYKAGQANLERIAKGGKLARLAVVPAAKEFEKSIRTLSEYRRTSRVLICAGGKEYVENICKALNSDQLKDTNNIPELLQEVDFLVVPVLLTGSSDNINVGDTKRIWRETQPLESDRNFDSTRSDDVIGFPRDQAAWLDYLESEVATATKQGFDVIEKGFTITVKKNGKILRRATGTPNWGDLIEAMEVMDGSKFGMPGDSEKYGGP
jgi:hypothetical protein